MLSIRLFKEIYIYRPAIDFRCGIAGLSGIVQDQMGLNPFEKYLFLFTNNKKDRIKALYWDETGFVLWYKVLESEKYKWPFHLSENILTVNAQNFERFLQGLNPWEQGHKKLNFSKI